MIKKLLVVALALPLVLTPATTQERPPIIDMHLHALTADWTGPPPLALCIPLHTMVPAFDPNKSWGDVFLDWLKNPPCEDPIRSPKTDEAVMEQTIAVLKHRNVIGVLGGPPERVRRWSQAGPGRFIPSVQFLMGRDDTGPDAIRQLFESGEFAVLGEVTNQYVGVAPDDERMAPYWALAEELNVPVLIHLAEGFPGVPYFGLPKYRVGLSSPFMLEDVLVRHPRLRVAVAHFASPLVEQMIAMLATYPQLYVDIGGMAWMYPREYFYQQLKQFIDAGFGKRVMFGSDQMSFPGLIEAAIDIVEAAPFLSEEQKRDIFYNNAARFLRLSEKEIARHHGG